MENKTILTLDAGGTNFVFSAMWNYEFITQPIILPSNADNLDKCLNTIINGFYSVAEKIPHRFDAISFAFPGPADYKNGIIGDLANLPAFRGGVALGPMLSNIFDVPVFINNDGDLFALGEFQKGFLPFVNVKMKENNIEKRFNNLIGVTLGTGFGAGVVINGQLLLGDNSNGAEVWLMRDGIDNNLNVEEYISIRAIKRSYSQIANLKYEDVPEPADIYKIAIGELEGDKVAALESFNIFGRHLGEALANLITIFDAPVVIGGGIANAASLFFPAMINQLNSTFESNGLGRLVQKVYPLLEEKDFKALTGLKDRVIEVPKSDQKIQYNENKFILIGKSNIGTSEAVSIGAYSFAINELRKYEN